jgi:hypothetical protein
VWASAFRDSRLFSKIVEVIPPEPPSEVGSLFRDRRIENDMAAGVTDHLWTMADLVELIESRECEAAHAIERWNG